ncbi:MAG: phosphoglycolate phosphatase [Steroidobacteraceae bacterium]
MIRLMDYIQAVAFDLDGTLIDTAPDLAAAANVMLVMLGARPVREHRVPALIGEGIDRFVWKVLEESRGRQVADTALHATAAALFRSLYRQRLFERSRVYPSVMQTLDALTFARRPMCCITNKESPFAVPLLEAAGLSEHFVMTVCADRAQDRKPAPNLLLAACTRLGVKPSRLLYVGDSRSDILAARAAGCRVVAVDYGYSHYATLAQGQADGIIGSLSEIITVGVRPRAGVRTLRAVS